MDLLGGSPRTASARCLVDALNNLLAALSLPFILDSPTDLTPSLLLAILESILCARLPLPSAIRASRNPETRVEAMHVFLGVFHCDLLDAKTDADASIGLGEVDPERLAEGEWDEVVFVGRLLCWLARRRGIVDASMSYDDNSDADISLGPRGRLEEEDEEEQGDLSIDLQDLTVDDDDTTFGGAAEESYIPDVPRHPRVLSPSTTMSAHTELSMHSANSSSVTSVHGDDATPAPSSPVSRTASPASPHGLLCIHERDDPSPLLVPDASIDKSTEFFQRPSATGTQSFCSCDNSRNPDMTAESFCTCSCRSGDLSSSLLLAPATPVRHSGWIAPVDEDAELNEFFASQGSRSNPAPGQSRIAVMSSAPQQSKTSPSLRTPSTPTPKRSSLRSPLSNKQSQESSRIRERDPSPPFDISFPERTSTPRRPSSNSQPCSATRPSDRSRFGGASISPSTLAKPPTRIPMHPLQKARSPTAQTLLLTSQRARLLTELADIRLARARCAS